MPADSTTPTAAPQLLTYRQTAEALQVSERSIQNWVADGSLPAIHFAPVKVQQVRRKGKMVTVRHGGAVRIDPADLAAFIAARKGARQ